MSAEHVITAFRRVLRDSEHLKCAAEVDTLGKEHQLLGIISNVSSGHEEGALLVISHPESPLIEAIVPIYAIFTLSVSQTAIPTDEEPTKATLVTTFSNGTDPPLSVVAASIDALSDVVKEAQRLAALAKVHGFVHGHSHSFTSFYTPAPLRDRRRSTSHSLSSAHAHAISRPLKDLRTGRRRASQVDTNGSVLPALNVEAIRADWIRRQMSQRQAEYTETTSIKVAVCTYNVNDRLPDAETNLKAWLRPELDADLIVIGLQEMDVSGEALLRFSPIKQAAWSRAFESALGEDYRRIGLQQFASMCSWAYASKELLDRAGIVVVQSHGVGTGPLGAGNKGATALRIQIDFTVLTFVNAHLAAFEHMTPRRNADLIDIFKRLSFPIEKPSDPHTVIQRPPSLRSDALSGVSSHAHAFETDAIFVAGDLNYRVDPRPSNAELVTKQQWEALLAMDQLNVERKAGRALADFTEGRITHPPTFKYDIGTLDTFDTSEKARAPAWTDRASAGSSVLTRAGVLWKSRDDSVRQLSLDAHMELRMSDHKPVSSLFEVDVRVEVPAKRAEVLDAVHRELDRFENDALPSIVVEPSPAIDFLSVGYVKAESRTLHLRNTGFVVTEFAFAPKPGSTSICEPWLWLQPRAGLVLPGDSAVVTATVLIDAPERFNFGEAEIEDILILRLVGGRDLFLSVSARQWQRTCFGNRLERLAWLDRPIRDYTPAELEALVAKPPVTARSMVPPVILRLTEWLTEHATDVEGLFLTAVDPHDVDQIREQLDTGAPFALAATSNKPTELKLSLLSVSEDVDLGDEDGILHQTDIGIDHSSRQLALAVADALLQLLHSLPEAVVPAYEAALEADGIEHVFGVIATIPRVNATTLTHLAAFLRATLIVHPDESTKDKLSVVFSNAILRAPVPASTQPGQPMRRKRFVKALLSEM